MPQNNSRQLKLPLPLTRDNFFVSDGNRNAIAMIDAYPNWNTAALIIVGDKGSGKTHLAQILKTKDKRIRIFEDIDRNLDEASLFTALNEPNGKTLITSRIAPADLAISTADLRSRLSAQICVKIGVPDDGLIRAVTIKLLADRGFYIEQRSLAHIVGNVERSFSFLNDLAETAERFSDRAGKRYRGLQLLPLKTVKDILTILGHE